MKKITLFLLSLFVLFALVPADPVSAAGSGSRVDNYIYYVDLPQGTNWGAYSHYYATDWKMDTWDSFLYTTESFNSYGTSECAMPTRPDTIADCAAHAVVPDTYPTLAGATAADDNAAFVGDIIKRYNKAGDYTIVVFYKVGCQYCSQLLNYFATDAKYKGRTDVHFILVDAEAESVAGRTDALNKVAPSVNALNDAVVFYDGTAPFTNAGYIYDLGTKYTQRMEGMSTPFVLIFQGNGTTVDLRALTNGPKSYGAGGDTLITAVDDLINEDPANPLNEDTDVPPTPGGNIEKEIVGSGDYDATFTANALYSEAFKVLEEVNKKRLAADPTATVFTMDKDLMTAAMQRAAEIAFYYRAEDLPTGGRSHLRPNGDNGPKAITGTTKYSSPVGGRLVVTENIAEGYADAQATLNAWLGSTHGHCAAIMDSISQAKSGCADGENNYGIQSVGVGYVVTEDGEIHSTILFSNQPAVEIQKGAIADATGKNWDIKVSNTTTNNMTVKPVSSYTRQADTSFPTLTTPVTFNSTADAAKTISFSSDYKYDPAQSGINHSIFQPTYVNVTGGSAVKAEVQNGKVVLTPQSAGTVTVQVGLAASGTGGQPKVMNTFEVTVGGATPTEYQVTLNYNQGTLGGQSSQVVSTTNGQINLSNYVPTRSGWTLTGWNSSTGQSGVNGLQTVTSNVTYTAQWQENPKPEYNITLDLDGGSLTHALTFKTTNQTVNFSQVGTPTKVGFDFIGWQDLTNGGNVGKNMSKQVDRDTNFKAQWNPQTFSVTFDMRGHGTAQQPVAQTVNYGGKVTQPSPDPTETGWDFGGWTTASGTHWNFTTDTVTANLVLYAKWDEQRADGEHTVTLYLNGGDLGGVSGLIEKTTTGQKFDFGGLGTPTRYGYSFDKWADNQTGQPVSGIVDLTGNAEYRADWTPNVHTVTFENEHGTASTQNFNFGAMIPEPTQPSAAGYTFEGWYNRKDNTLFDFSLPVMVDENLTLYAKWTALPAAEYNVTLNGNGGTINGSPTYTTQTVNQQIDLGAQPQPQMSGFVFNGWTDAAGMPVSGVQTLSADAVYDAAWTPVPAGEYYVTLNGNGGTINGSPTYTTQTVNQQIDLGAQPQPQMPGYIFNGWTDAAGMPVSGVQTLSADAVYNAAWTPVPAGEYYVTLDLNGGSINGQSRITVSTVNGMIDLRKYRPSKVGNTFERWVDAFGNPAGGIVTLTEDSTFTAVWRVNPVRPYIDLFSLWKSGDYDWRLPATGFSASHLTALGNQPLSLKYSYKGMKLQIPSLDVSADIVEVPAEDGSWSVEWLGSDIGLLEGSAMPGEGRAFIAAHNHLSTMEVGPFARIALMEVGSRAFVSDEQNDLMSFEVYANKKISADDVDSMFEIASLEENSLTFISCEDEMIEGGYASRRIVSLRPLAKLSVD